MKLLGHCNRKAPENSFDGRAVTRSPLGAPDDTRGERQLAACPSVGRLRRAKAGAAILAVAAPGGSRLPRRGRSLHEIPRFSSGDALRVRVGSAAGNWPQTGRASSQTRWDSQPETTRPETTRPGQGSPGMLKAPRSRAAAAGPPASRPAFPPFLPDRSAPRRPPCPGRRRAVAGHQQRGRDGGHDEEEGRDANGQGCPGAGLLQAGVDGLPQPGRASRACMNSPVIPASHEPDDTE